MYGNQLVEIQNPDSTFTSFAGINLEDQPDFEDLPRPGQVTFKIVRLTLPGFWHAQEICAIETYAIEHAHTNSKRIPRPVAVPPANASRGGESWALNSSSGSSYTFVSACSFSWEG